MDPEEDFAALEKRKKTCCYTELIYHQELLHDCYYKNRIVVTRRSGEFSDLNAFKTCQRKCEHAERKVTFTDAVR